MANCCLLAYFTLLVIIKETTPKKSLYYDNFLATQARVQAKIKLNVAHSSTQVKIEMPFRVIKAHFACLQGLQVCQHVWCAIILPSSGRKERQAKATRCSGPVTLDYPTRRAVRETITYQFFS